MKLLFIGDVVGSPGRNILKQYLPRLKQKYNPIITIVNGENAAGGRGITEKIYKELLDAGTDVITMGNHTWDNKEIFDFIDEAKQLVRPANFPEEAPGQGSLLFQINGYKIAVINLQGRTFLPSIDCPFKKADELVQKYRKLTPYIFVDFHAEATSEKQALGWFLDGKATAVIGTHTHVQTADNRILPKGTAYMTDVGMTGPYDGILGMKPDAVITKFLTSLPVRFEVLNGRAQLCGICITIDEETGAALATERIFINEDHPIFD